MREEAILERPPARTRIRRRILWVAILTGTIALVVLLWGTLNREPRYRGKTRAQWFPYLWDLSKGPLPGAALTNGALESFPVLWAALRAEAPGWAPQYHTLYGSLQSWVGLSLPPAVGDVYLRTRAANAVLRSAASPPFAKLVVSNWEDLPSSVRFDLVRALATEDRLQPLVARIGENLHPILSGMLTDTNLHLQTLAAYSLLRAPGLSEDDLRRIARLGRQRSSGKVNPNHYLMRLGLYRGAGRAERRVLADVLSEGQMVAEDRFQLPLCLLDPDRYPPAQYWESTGNLQRDWTRRRGVGELIAFVSQPTEEIPPDELATWLGNYLISDLESATHADRAVVMNQILEAERLGFLSNLSSGLGSRSRWLDGLAEGFSASSPRVRLAAAMAIVRLRGTSLAFVAAATSALLRGQDPEVMLRILTAAKVVPAEVASLVHTLAAGEMPDGWREVPRGLSEAAQALVTAAASSN